MPRHISAQALEAQLEATLMDAMQGDPWGPQLAGRLRRDARALLLRHGLGRATVAVSRQGAVVHVEILLPPGPQKVRSISLALASG
jgi:hypothetical protein